ncbi:MAG TPA: type II and III secretion system protein family protein [Vicinamibacterales bacterium]|nr:type II and III secretion system protein family protein [Vicinamibacterales bacterium]
MRRYFVFRAAIVAAVMCASVPSIGVFAQQVAETATTGATGRIGLTAGRSTVLTSDFDITRIAVTNPSVADATVVQPREILIDGKAPGTITLIVWGADRRLQYDVVVEATVPGLQQQLQQLFPGEDIRVSLNEESVILMGHVSSNAVMLRAAEIAEATSAKTTVINMLQLPGGSDSQQVMLQVRFAEVNRRALHEAGISFITSGIGFHNVWGRTTTQQFAAPGFEDLQSEKTGDELTKVSGKLTFSDFLNLFFLSPKYDIGAVIRALESSGHFQSLAEPNLIAYNNQEASFLAGGEFPVPVVQGNSGTVTIQFREFGVRLNFKPTIAGDMIRLKVRPEVSSLDFANGLSLGGFRVPALTTRRAETDVELRDGQSFAIAGLLNNLSQDDAAAIPILSKLPVIGALFKSKSRRAERTELMVLITPRLVRALNPDEVPPLPTRPGSFLPAEDLGDQLQGGGGTVDAPAETR